MRRRELIAFAAAAWLAWPRFARAQQQAKSARLGFLGFGDSAAWPRVEVLRASLRELGYVEGKNLVIEFLTLDNTERSVFDLLLVLLVLGDHLIPALTPLSRVCLELVSAVKQRHRALTEKRYTREQRL